MHAIATVLNDLELGDVHYLQGEGRIYLGGLLFFQPGGGCFFQTSVREGASYFSRHISEIFFQKKIP